MRLSSFARWVLALAFASLAACSKGTGAPAESWPDRIAFDAERGPDTALELSGLVNGGRTAYFSLDRLETLPRTEFASEDPWVPGRARYRGVALAPLLDALALDARARQVRLVAVNDYSVTVALEELRRLGYVLVWEEDGKRYDKFPDERNKGPLTVAFPHEAFPGVDMEEHKLNYVWWLARIVVTE
ncbi:MAG TPA: hypothetical protein PKW82_10885 [Spirochaetales bacterium]|nr:hypothetical protein [Spirochaetales bacterium]